MDGLHARRRDGAGDHWRGLCASGFEQARSFGYALGRRHHGKEPKSKRTELVATSTIDRRRGHTEVRRLRTTAALNDYLTSMPRVGQVAELTRTVADAKGTHQEVVFL